MSWSSRELGKDWSSQQRRAWRLAGKDEAASCEPAAGEAGALSWRSVTRLGVAQEAPSSSARHPWGIGENLTPQSPRMPPCKLGMAPDIRAQVTAHK